MQVRDIKNEIDRVEKLNKQVGDDFIISSKYKDDREWWVLGTFINLLYQSKLEVPKYAVKGLPPDPDFITFGSDKKRFRPIEIVEILERGRKRGLECRSEESEAMFVNEDWSVFVENLEKKFIKRYDKDCWLLAYHDILITHHTAYGYWDKIMLANAKQWYQKDTTSSFCLSDSPYEQIFVIDSGGKAAVKIFPKLEVIKPSSRGH